MTTITTMRALVLDAEQRTANVQNVSIPTPGPLEILVQVRAVALNPVDSLYVAEPLGATGRVVGSDFAGVVVAYGRDIPGGSQMKPGTRVAGFLQGTCSVNDRPGAFAEYLTCPWDLVYIIPESIGCLAASTMSLCGLTAAQAIYYRLGLPTPWRTKIHDLTTRSPHGGAELNFLVYSASTSVGMYASQLIRKSAEAMGTKIKLFGTASNSRFALLQSKPYLYDVLVDYRDSDWRDQILKETNGRALDYAIDCISEGDTVGQISHMLKPNGKMAIVRSTEGGAWSTDAVREDVDPVYGAVWEGLGEDIQYQGLRVEKSLQARRFAVDYYRWLSDGGRLEPNRVRSMPGGLDRIVPDGFMLLGTTMEAREQMKARPESWMKPVSAEKLVYEVETKG